MVLGAQPQPLELADRPVPSRDRGRCLCGCACGVCRTDVRIVDGKLTKRKLPLVPGHQIVGIATVGVRVSRCELSKDDRIRG